MIEGGGLGTFSLEQIGPSNVQSRNGVIDVLVKDETGAVAAKKPYLLYFRGSIGSGTALTRVCYGMRCRRTACAHTICGASSTVI
ncbi:hypothetical protein [Bradyrhizobium macuxiense]|nr:hypothetical protein [Bradyrhizobium macuxiense]